MWICILAGFTLIGEKSLSLIENPSFQMHELLFWDQSPSLISELSPSSNLCRFNERRFSRLRPIYARLEKRMALFRDSNIDYRSEYISRCKQDSENCQSLSVRNGELRIHQMGTGYETRHSDLIRMLNRLRQHLVDIPDVNFMVDTSDGGYDTQVLPMMMINDHIKKPRGIMVPDWSFYDWPTSRCPGERTRRFTEFLINSTNRYNDLMRGPRMSKTPKMFWRGAKLDNPVREDQLNKILGTRPDSIPADFYDIEIMRWIFNNIEGSNEADNCVTMHEHCQYQFLLHLRGNTSSNRLKYLLLCGSIVIMPEQDFEEWWSPAIPPGLIVRVKDDVSDIHDRIAELYNPDGNLSDRVLSMSRETLEFALDVFSQKNVDCYWVTVLNAAAKTWGFFLNSTGRSVEEALREPNKSFSDL
jgi:hypothetical protein